GPTVADAILAWFHDKDNRKGIDRRHAVGVRITISRLTTHDSRLSGQSFVFTGELESLSRDEAKELVRAHGGDVSESVSRKTAYVVVGAEPGSKFTKAEQLGVRILDEPDFLRMVNAT
ncbi:NAD-dependent DNA ligase LigA, partial [Candidatus Uhrbacteria bacterium]|nr:NAD-dependent DNA ligase LigA [Candidatus Uhrbacteria bacterium]